VFFLESTSHLLFNNNHRLKDSDDRMSYQPAASQSLTQQNITYDNIVLAIAATTASKAP
jgi:hypothetical protein